MRDATTHFIRKYKHYLLPLRFTEPDEEHPCGMVYIDWQDEWSLDEFEDE